MFALVAAAAFALSDADGTFLCVCRKDLPAPDIVFRGVVIDAELRASIDGRSVQPRQATIFNVEKTIKGAAATPMKVWHVTDQKKCGVRFNYGEAYTVKARLKNGAAETDLCLMPELKQEEPE